MYQAMIVVVYFFVNKKFLLLCLKNLDFVIEYTETRPRETLEFKLDKVRETFSFDFHWIKEMENGLLIQLAQK